MTMKCGVIVPQGWRMDLVGIKDPVEAYETMTGVAQAVEELGYDSVWLFDHFHTVPVPTQEVTFECWMSTAALARDTKRVRIGQIVTCNAYRNPALLAKMASTVDVLSHGRRNFGIGAGWYEHEYKAYGYQYPDAPTRLRYLREGVQVILKMWSDEEAYFSPYGEISSSALPRVFTPNCAMIAATTRNPPISKNEGSTPICGRIGVMATKPIPPPTWPTPSTRPK